MKKEIFIFSVISAYYFISCMKNGTLKSKNNDTNIVAAITIAIFYDHCMIFLLQKIFHRSFIEKKVFFGLN